MDAYREDLEGVGYTNPIYLASALKKRGLEPLKELLQDIVTQQDSIIQKRFGSLSNSYRRNYKSSKKKNNLSNSSLSDDSASVQRKLNEQRAKMQHSKAELRESQTTEMASAIS